MRFRLTAALCLCFASLARVWAQSPAITSQSQVSPELLAAARWLALGRADAEAPATGTNLGNLVDSHVTALRGDPTLQAQVATRAWADAHGRAPTAAEIADTPAGTTYAALMRRHVTRFAAQPQEYRGVVDRAYRLVVNRAAYEEEHAYWKPYGALPYVLLVGSIENWAQRNQPGLMVTTGTPSISVNSRFLTTKRLSLGVANEVRTVLGLPVWSDVGRLRNPDRYVIAVGSANIASVGGVHFLVAGGGPLAALPAN